MKQVTAITAAIRAAGLTPTGLEDLLLTVDAEASKTTVARIKVILDGLCNLPLTEGRSLLSETAKPHGADDAEKQEYRKTPKFRTVKQRVSECRQLYGAVKLIEGFRAMIEEKSLGWASAVSAARIQLEGKNLKPDGGPVVSQSEREAKALKAARIEVLAERMTGNAEADKDLLATADAAARANLFKAEIEAHANRIGSVKGKDYCLALADALMMWEPKEVAA